jgi:hypothetical protein
VGEREGDLGADFTSLVLPRPSIPLPMAMNMCEAPSYSLISTWTFASRVSEQTGMFLHVEDFYPAIAIDVLGHFRSNSSGA